MSPPPSATIIVAATSQTLGIGRSGTLPWRLKTDLSFFARVTSRSPSPVVIMGRKTYFSIPPRFRPLRNRVNIVISRNPDGLELADGVVGVRSVTEAVEKAGDGGRVWIIGGGEIYKSALEEGVVGRVLVTRVEERDGWGCDTFFPVDVTKGGWEKVSVGEFVGEEVKEGRQEEEGVGFEFELWEKR